ncbi:conserved hypothetical protein [Theileria equi strain WA]|uniref:Uncharacterized protein n=1 Tax=Theileria equi strain WA TaxID=1537102 RepID=L1LAH5_THEEQ|nr:conserved hypothetical protein [Theileria equi strain WA]EKX72265.1 conserved hypothetical protein [Theileria equi strain WA]|eukprot:XP_004831717.1 conserved hypothetical protein [Theileria equi strain WA]
MAIQKSEGVLGILKNGQRMVGMERAGSRLKGKGKRASKHPVEESSQTIQSASFTHYTSNYVNALVGVLEGTLTPEEAQGILALPLKELLEDTLNGTPYSNLSRQENMEKVDAVLNEISKALLLSVLFIGKAKTQYRNGALEDVSAFLYKLAMLIDGTMEKICGSIASNEGNLERKNPENPKMLLHIWTILLSLVYAKEKRLRVTFCTIALHLVRSACIDEIMITSVLFEKHVQTFVSLLTDQNKDVRCAAVKVLESFQVS